MEEDQSACKIRSMLPDDVAAVTEIEALVNPNPWSEKQFRAEFENPRSNIDLITSEHQIAGYICSWMVADELEIQNVATAPAFRRQGFAEKLLRFVIDRALNGTVSRVFLEVRVGNTAAIALYEKFGFRNCGVRAGYYADNEDALLMERNLSTLD